MKNNISVLLPVVAALSLAGCGSSSKDEGNPAVVEKPTPVIPPVSKKIELKTVFEGCAGEEPKSNVNIVFHDALGAVVAQGASNAEGIFEGSIPADAKHISIVDTDIKESLHYQGRVVTHMDIEDGLNLGKFNLSAPEAYQGCDVPAVSPCFALRVDYTEIKSVYPNHSVISQQGDILDLHKPENLVSVPGHTEIQSCDDHEAFQFALVSPDGTVAKAARVKPSQYITPLTVELKREDFIYDGVAVDTSHFEFGGDNSHPELGGDTSIMSYVKVDREIFPYDRVFSASTTAMQFIFPDLAESHHYRAVLSEQIEINDYSVYTVHSSRSTITDTGQLHFEVPIALAKSIDAEFLSGSLNNSFSFDFDFSNLDERLQTVNWAFYPKNDAGEVIRWSIASDKSGTIPRFQFGEQLDISGADFSALQDFEITLWGHPYGPNGFKAYREFRSNVAIDFDRPEYKSFVQARYIFTKLVN
ncbi:hypothetical protein [Pseudoalteromonas luteoviolacea]|uniref:Uncharacterized protein n=1 Tax=Pseudoalteromonas luteoviolacea S4054 TaxID=1129367 RepID=A0A0F6A4L2_9GAMM|nr:hypothetical protein [Pseudoalteromonas luteoviolacea]AOT09121.1 hypothetical protein S4054249_15240 [Pseudoalteromonas luteoviolacea]AOT14034.1 hypothetical protein S40542_15210 [Pseudoalteromonas luteoviolacea]AOT18949.1 hypothetical protein S4054_15215 [Pseudoalteromonas luteoviolacea]KKE81018.1 hypothetical protein N479_23840 [Pseudoalteromonas luteoviolacea S4054]KZN70296.1 hypothetical protein N481_02150 [Pseudoalteromonas luteoviolacea S4047-1]